MVMKILINIAVLCPSVVHKIRTTLNLTVAYILRGLGIITVDGAV